MITELEKYFDSEHPGAQCEIIDPNGKVYAFDTVAEGLKFLENFKYRYFSTLKIKEKGDGKRQPA